ncbi:MAG: hypothetical protein K2Q20_06920, partial [Phycisphaerales bacterium]|nr:hypothetical protein [Phycisphaerales bacterium]
MNTPLRKVLSGFVVLFAVTHAALARTGPLIAELVDYERVRSVVPRSTLDAFVDTCSPAPEQRAAAADLIAAAREDLARAVNRHLRTVRDDSTFDQVTASEARVVEQAAQIERRLLEDLRAIVTGDDAEERFASFERAHRRSLLSGASRLKLPANIRSVVAKAGLDAEAAREVTALLDRLDVETDTALVREVRAMRAYAIAVRAPYDASPEAEKRLRSASRESDEASNALEKLLTGAIDPVLSRLPEGVR